MIPERRRLPRHPMIIDAVLITPRASIPVRTVDIGSCGIRIRCPEPVRPETDVALALATGTETLLSGSVLWVLEKADAADEAPYELGIDADAIILQEREAMGFIDKTALVEELLSRLRRPTDSKPE